MKISLNLLFQLKEARFVSRSDLLLGRLHRHLIHYGYNVARLEVLERDFDVRTGETTSYFFIATSPVKKSLLKILMAFTEEVPTIRLEFCDDGSIEVWGAYHEEVSD